MAKVKNFKTVFPAVSVPLNDDYTINEPEFRAYLRWMKTFYNKGIQGLVCNGHKMCIRDRKDVPHHPNGSANRNRSTRLN